MLSKWLLKNLTLNFIRCGFKSSALHYENVVSHEDTTENNAEIKFNFTACNQLRVCTILKMYPIKRAALMPLLDLAQRQHGWLSISAINKVAEIIEVDAKEVLNTALYYNMLKRYPMGKYHVQVCSSLPCMLRGGDRIWETCKNLLIIDDGETTKTKQFSLTRKMCMGACVNAPVVAINDDYYEDMTTIHMEEIIYNCYQNIYTPHGPIRDRSAGEPKHKLTSLTNPPNTAGFGIQECFADNHDKK